MIMEQKSKVAALKGKLTSATLGRIDELQHHCNWLLQLCKKSPTWWEGDNKREGGTGWVT